jgi:hypothetical protein
MGVACRAQRHRHYRPLRKVLNRYTCRKGKGGGHGYAACRIESRRERHAHGHAFRNVVQGHGKCQFRRTRQFAARPFARFLQQVLVWRDMIEQQQKRYAKSEAGRSGHHAGQTFAT